MNLTSNTTADIYLQVIEKNIFYSPEIEIIFSKGNKIVVKFSYMNKNFGSCLKNKIFFIRPSIPKSCECKFTFLCPKIPIYSSLNIYGQKFQKVENEENLFFAITSSKLVRNWFCKKHLLRNNIFHNYCFLYVL